MKNNKATFKEQIAAWKDNRNYVGDLASSFYFFDWFCREYALSDRARKIMPKAIKFAKRKKVDLDKTYVMFKNNCPMSGSLYDDFRICDLETGDVLWTVIPASGHENIFGQAEVWGTENSFSSEIAKAPSWTELILNTTH